MNEWHMIEDMLPPLDEGSNIFKQSHLVLCALQWWDESTSEEISWYNQDGTWGCESENCKVIAWADYTKFEDRK